MKLISGVLAIEGIEPNTHEMELYKGFADPQNRAHHLIRTISVNGLPGLVDKNNRPIVIPADLAEICMFFRRIIGMNWSRHPKDIQEWYDEGGEASSDYGPLSAARAADLYLRTEVRAHFTAFSSA